METIPEKIYRHIKDRDFRPDTINRGLRLLAGSAGTVGRGDEILLEGIEKKHLGIPDFRRQIYGWSANPRVFDLNLALGKGPPRVELFDFPSQAELNIAIRDEKMIHTLDFLAQVPHALAVITGPTFKSEVHLPNNGFYLAGYKTTVPFGEIRPSDRRGAFGIKKDGELVLIDDAQKLEVIRSNFKDFEAVIGTPFYFKDNDDITALPETPDGITSPFSYLVKYTSSDSISRFCFLTTRKFDNFNRRVIQKVIDQYTSQVKAQNYTAVELEYVGGHISMNLGQNLQPELTAGGQGYPDRYDHYFVTLPK